MQLSKSFMAMSLAAAVLTSGIMLVGQAEAKPGRDNGRNCAQYDCVYQSLTTEKQAQYDAIMKEFTDKTAPLRDSLSAKYIELRTLGSSPAPDPKAVGKASEELVTLRNEFTKERLAMSERLAKEVGITIFQNRGYRGMGDQSGMRGTPHDGMGDQGGMGHGGHN